MDDFQRDVIAALGVKPTFDAEAEIRRRIEFLKIYLETSRLTSYVLGISGGVDSLTAGLLAQEAVRQLRDTGYDARFVAVRLPYGTQADEVDARRAMQAIKADRELTINIKPAADATLDAIVAGGLGFADAAQKNNKHNNNKTHQHKNTQYALAGTLRGLVNWHRSCSGSLDGFLHQVRGRSG